MSNEVIIDGCNVAECKNFDEEMTKYNVYDCCEMEGFPRFCKGYECYFKQLKRLKAEKQDLINYFELREGGMLEDIQYWKNKAQYFYKELEQYKESKQASYEAMQREWNYAINTLRDVEAENEKLKKEVSDLNFYIDSYKITWEIDKYKQAFEEIRDLNNKTVKIPIITEKINEVLNNVDN